jgi:spermidine/putrescine transport system ATP-binding protein
MNDGVIEHLGAPREIYEHPATRFVAGFIGTSNLLTGTVGRVLGGEAIMAFGADEHVIVSVPGRDAQPGEQLEVTVRPEKIHISTQVPGPDECALRGTVAEVVYLGTATNFNVTTSTGAEVVVFVQNASAVGQDGSDGIRRGDDVWLTWDKQHSYAIGG